MSTRHCIRHLRAAFHPTGRLIAFGAMGLLAALIMTSGVAAAAISQGYQSNDTLKPGVLVSAEQGSTQSGKATLADTSNADSLLGVVVKKNEATLAVSSPNDQLQVATSGEVEAFVSDLGGDVKDGDPVGVSPIRGVGMKALEAGKIVGIAQGDVGYSSQTTEVKSSDGKTHQAKIGTVHVQLQIVYYTPPPDKSPIPQFLQVFINNIAGKQVSLVRLVASSLIVMGAMVAIAILLYSAVRSTMVSIGRNPLAQTSIYRGLWQVVFTCLAIFIVALGSAYVVLTR